DKSFDLPVGESSRSYEASPAVAGRLMVMASHMHEYATKIVFEDITENEIIWEGFPVEEEGQLSGVTIGRLYKRFGVKIFPDHRYRVTVHYTNPTGEAIAEGGMGVVAGLFMPARGEEWPAAEPNNPLYALDRDHYMQVVRGKYDLIKDGGGKIGDMMNMKKGMDHSHN
ncbi:MAG: hypothetical protein IID06_03855, partial [Gemmatimonadetes bacterium]|nr:hypothetical protein [Gemmatimonadota bacterium]